MQQNHAFLYPTVRPYLYTGVYGLIGVALHFQDQDEEALKVHYNGYLAALAVGQSWYIAQSLICQSDCYHALGQYNTAIFTIEEALGYLEHPEDEAEICAKAHLLTCWADNAMMLKDYRTAQEKLEMSQAYLGQIVPNEEFDEATWLLLAGKYALLTENYIAATQSFEEALRELPKQWTLRRTITALGLVKAYARMKERDRSISVAEELVPTMKMLNARLINKWFLEYLKQDLLGVFPTDNRVQVFVNDMYRRIS